MQAAFDFPRGEAMQVKHIREVTTMHFVNWLEKHTEMLPWKEFPTERGRIALQKAKRHGDLQNPSCAVIDGMYIVTVSEEGKAPYERAFPITEYIRFDFVSLDAKRTEITTTCIAEEPILAYCDELLAEIEQRWHTENDTKQQEIPSRSHTQRDMPAENTGDSSSSSDSTQGLQSKNLRIVWTDQSESEISRLPNLPTPRDMPVPENPFIAFEDNWEVIDNNLVEASHLFFIQLIEHSEWTWFRVIALPGENREKVEIIGNRDGIDAHVRIKVRRSRLFVESDYRDWAVLSKGYEIFRQFLIQQGYVKPPKKRILGLRADYLVVAVVLGIMISLASLVLSPDWARSNLALVVLFPVGFAGATAVIANVRRAFE